MSCGLKKKKKEKTKKKNHSQRKKEILATQSQGNQLRKHD